MHFCELVEQNAIQMFFLDVLQIQRTLKKGHVVDFENQYGNV